MVSSYSGERSSKRGKTLGALQARFKWDRQSRKFAYQFRNERNRFPPWPNVWHTVDVAVEGIVTGMSVVASASVAGSVAILQFSQ